ncbi:hypothetical protein ES708_31194 [subsurface metagenome]
MALRAGTADITVSYTEGGITKTDIVKVVVAVSVPKVLPEITVNMPTFIAGGESRFTLDIEANDYEGEMVKYYFTLPPGHAPIDTWGGQDPILYTIEWLTPFTPTWLDLTLIDQANDAGTYNAATGVVVIGAAEGTLLFDEEIFFKATFDIGGIYKTTLKVKTYPDGDLLCTKVITVEVLPALPGA